LIFEPPELTSGTKQKFMNLALAEIMFILPILIFILIPMMFFLIAQRDLLKAIEPDNRTIQPNEVWLQLIPVFNLYWQFVVVDRIADSIRNELVERHPVSFGATSNSAFPIHTDERPTHDLGRAYCILGLIGVLGFFTFFLLCFAGLAATICWIVYWVKIAEYKNRFLSNTF
jgi:hypothetical protein